MNSGKLSRNGSFALKVLYCSFLSLSKPASESSFRMASSPRLEANKSESLFLGVDQLSSERISSGDSNSLDADSPDFSAQAVNMIGRKISM